MKIGHQRVFRVACCVYLRRRLRRAPALQCSGLRVSLEGVDFRGRKLAESIAMSPESDTGRDVAMRRTKAVIDPRSRLVMSFV